jgi:hypothetical protein
VLKIGFSGQPSLKKLHFPFDRCEKMPAGTVTAGWRNLSTFQLHAASRDLGFPVDASFMRVVNCTLIVISFQPRKIPRGQSYQMSTSGVK